MNLCLGGANFYLRSHQDTEPSVWRDMTSLSLHNILDSLLRSIWSLFQPSSETYWLFLTTGALIIAASYRAFYLEKAQWSLLGFVRFLFPQETILHRSALIDYEMFFLNFFYQGLLSAYILRYLPDVARPTKQFLLLHLAHMNSAYRAPASFHPDIWFTLAVFTAADLAFFLVHVAFHKVPILWEFHKIHHSAEALNPITAYRGHPLNLIATQAMTGLLVGVASGVFGFLNPEHGVREVTVKGVNVFLFSYNMVGGFLRHSSVWCHYGKRMNYVLYSPAHHQIHHSENPQHWDKNFGGVLSIWDYMLGTLYVPAGRESLNYGLGEKTENDRYNRSVFLLYTLPFTTVWSRYLMPAARRILP